jgi:hypothetical protein
MKRKGKENEYEGEEDNHSQAFCFVCSAVNEKYFGA